MTLKKRAVRQGRQIFIWRADIPQFANRQVSSHNVTRVTDIQSPCIDVCDVDSSGKYCIGCGRSMEEIAGWGSASDDERRAIMQILPERLRQLER